MAEPITPVELKAALQQGSVRLLDVRQPEEVAIAALPGSLHIPLGELEFRLAELDDWKREEVVVYCHHGIRSRRAQQRLEEAGFLQVRNLEGGLDRYSLEADASLPRYT